MAPTQSGPTAMPPADIPPVTGTAAPTNTNTGVDTAAPTNTNAGVDTAAPTSTNTGVDTATPTGTNTGVSDQSTSQVAKPRHVATKARAPGSAVGASAAAPAYCLWEGQHYRPGTDIGRGQRESWCYVTYCDSQGQLRFWDDFNCPPNSMKATSPHSSGRAAPPSRDPGHTGNTSGCKHGGQFYQPEQEISNHRAADLCYGIYCSVDSKVTKWEARCTPQGPDQGQGGSQPGQDGCYHNGYYFKPTEDVVSGKIGDMCYGYYCEGRNTFVHWEDHCLGQAAGVTV